MTLEGKRQRHPQRGYNSPSRNAGLRKARVLVEFTARDGTKQMISCWRSKAQLAVAGLAALRERIA